MVKAWKEKVIIPTYEVGKPEKNPIFLEKRVYQGSSGVVYPYPVIESISDEKTDKEYEAVFIENEYIKVMVLPELGGRVQMAYDKIMNRHFVYYNHVIKPALVGLAGPWISGGIEFNWPQHHRPSTFMPVDCKIEENADGSVTVWVSEMERMFHQKGMAGFTLRPGCAYLEIKGVLYNRTDIPQTFLWWANPAVKVNDHYQSVFPPDINAVFDHGKRAVSSYPIATGTYYKMDYSAGVDISNYKNIKVPTSYMGVESRFDFEGGYENDSKGGMLHVCSHHVSPGKKQWTWGNGDFGRAWDRNLTDEDGPYIELMAGVYTENQPDFTWLSPYEEKSFTQYFLPYRELGIVKNASKDILLNIEETGCDKVTLKLFATSPQEIEVKVISDSGLMLLLETISIGPEDIFEKSFHTHGNRFDSIQVSICKDGREVLSWHAEADEVRAIPDAAEAALRPEEIKTCEQLFLTGQHLEQYRHATYNPTDYYEEALRRDPDDVRNNNAMGLWYIRKCRFDLAERYLLHAVKTICRRNPNPYDGEPIYNLGLVLKYQGRHSEAYSRFYKATWNGAWQEAGYFECSRISTMQGRIEDALYEVDRALIRNAHNHKARALKTALLRHRGDISDALELIKESLAIDPFNFGVLFEKYLIDNSSETLTQLIALMRDDAHNYDEIALDYCAAGLNTEARRLWEIAISRGAVTPMTFYYAGYSHLCDNNPEEAALCFSKGKDMAPDYCFPNRQEAAIALGAATVLDPEDSRAPLLLGNLYYDKRQYDIAIDQWEKSAKIDAGMPMTWRNLALAYFNKRGEQGKAVEFMEKAFSLDKSDGRILMELDQLYKRLGYPHRKRLTLLENHPDLVDAREDLKLERITLMNLLGQHREAMEYLDSNVFHPWEGGEGKVPAQYQYSRVELAKEAITAGNLEEAERLLKECLVYPDHLGEGKLYGAQDNDFNYLLGIVLDRQGKKQEAREYWKKGTVGPTEPADCLYYNDAKPDKIFYAGLCWRALGEEDNARRLFNRLTAYGKQHLHDKVRMDYFAVSLPDLLIWEDDLDARNEIHCKYMLALGYAGLGDTEHTEQYRKEVERLNFNHMGIRALASLQL